MRPLALVCWLQHAFIFYATVCLLITFPLAHGDSSGRTTRWRADTFDDIAQAEDTTATDDSDGEAWHPFAGSQSPPRFSERLIRDIQAQSTNYTELFESFRPPADQWLNVTDFVDVQQHVYLGGGFFSHRSNAHVVSVHDARRTLSVYEPKGRGGCRGGNDNRTPVSKTATAFNCTAAVNAGFFNTTVGSCHGNIYSDGELVQTHDLQMPSFGIRADGTIIVGYLTEQDVLQQENPFVQLVSGVVWLVRNGTSFVASSLAIEGHYQQVQETGSERSFANVITARTVVGHDRNGVVKLIQFDGISWETGLTLYMISNILINEFNITNAINLDGGGSSTFALNGQLVNQPSDKCPPTRCNCPSTFTATNATECSAYCKQFRCERPVTTILCAHPPLCNNGRGCNHGTCENGECRCHPLWVGDDCSTLLCNRGIGCGAKGLCVDGQCNCTRGWEGDYCDVPQCHLGAGCGEHGVCARNGTCTCFAGWNGTACELQIIEPPSVPVVWQYAAETVLTTLAAMLALNIWLICQRSRCIKFAPRLQSRVGAAGVSCALLDVHEAVGSEAKPEVMHARQATSV